MDGDLEDDAACRRAALASWGACSSVAEALLLVRTGATELLVTDGLSDRARAGTVAAEPFAVELWIETDAPIADHASGWPRAVLEAVSRRLAEGAFHARALAERDLVTLEIPASDLHFEGQWPAIQVAPDGMMGVLVGLGASGRAEPVATPSGETRYCGVLLLNAGQLDAFRMFGRQAVENIASYGFVSRVPFDAVVPEPNGAPPDFSPILLPRPLVESADGFAIVERVGLGAVPIPDGRVFACDPIAPMDRQPFERTLAPGDHEAVAFVARPRNASAVSSWVVATALVVNDRPVVRWEIATRRFEGPYGAAGEGHPPNADGAYGVDSGTGCLMGSAAASMIFRDDDSAQAEIMDVFDRGDLADVVTLADGERLAVFQSGWGDGAYVSWWGLDAQGEPAMLVTDFCLHAIAVLPAPAPRRWWEFWR